MEIDKLKVRYKDHELTCILNTDDARIFEFKKPGTINNYQKWIITGATLIVLGDNYDAIYKWGSRISLPFLANCNLGYFNEKCAADYEGHKQEEFCSDYTKERIINIIVDHLYDCDKIDVDETKWKSLTDIEKLEHCKSLIMDQLDLDDYDFENLFYFENIYEVSDFLNDSINEFMIGSDGWEFTSRMMKLTIIPQLHLAALRVAHEKYPEIL